MAHNSPRVAIVGGGLGGLAAAAFLHQAGVPAVVYEQARELREVGAGIMVAPNAARMIRRLGVLGEFRKRAVRLDTGWEFRRWRDGTVLSAQDLTSESARRYGEHTYTVHRADLLGAVSGAVPAGTVRLGKRLDGFTVSGAGVRLSFADGEQAEADALIGADGIHSVIRATLTEPAPPAHSGLCAFRALVPAGAAPAYARRPAQAVWLGPGRHVVHYPVSGGELVNIVAVAPAGGYATESWTATATVAEFLAEFDGWDGRLVSLIGAARTPGRWALLVRQPLPRWTWGPVTLLGDAAHPMLPFLGQGAAQAFEDAAVLASCLAASPDDPARALRRYECARLDRASRIQRGSSVRSDYNHLPDGPEQEARDDGLRAADPLAANAWIYSHDPVSPH
jgi:2-polyprenyl-6-methoxyphenol hydroxylase-like FAD-dependent oxidoreductase